MARKTSEVDFSEGFDFHASCWQAEDPKTRKTQGKERDLMKQYLEAGMESCHPDAGVTETAYAVQYGKSLATCLAL